MVKTVNLTNAELKVEDLGYPHTGIVNLGGSVIYASKKPGIFPGGDNVIAIQPKSRDIVTNTFGTVYLYGSGAVECRGINNSDFKSASVVQAGNGGGDAITVNGHTVESDVPANAKFTDTVVDVSVKMDKENPTGTGALSVNRKADTAVGSCSVALGRETTASGVNSYAEGYRTLTDANHSHAEGYATQILATSSATAGQHVEGGYTLANGAAAHAQNWATWAEHNNSTACGNLTHTGCAYDFVIGHLNKPSEDSLLTIGGGQNSSINMSQKPDDQTYYEYGIENATLKNVFRVDRAGTVYGLNSYTTSGADYAEYIKPWADNNTENEDRRGFFVTIKNGKLHKAEPEDYIVGITSGNPSVVGNGDEDWIGRWQRDEFNELIYKDVEVDDYSERFNEDGVLVTVKVGSHIEKQTVQNPDYDPSQKYVERKDRPEWSCVGMIGVIPLRDDGTCEAGGFAKCGTGGIATKADSWDCHKTFFVIERVNDHIISVEMR